MIKIGTHPIPMKYFNAHKKLSFWQNAKMGEIAGHLLSESPAIMERYN